MTRSSEEFLAGCGGGGGRKAGAWTCPCCGGAGVWRPIAAIDPPMDGTPFDAWVETLNLKREVSGARVVGVFWEADKKDQPSFAGGRWVQPGMMPIDPPFSVETLHTRITHWMPEPSAPK